MERLGGKRAGLQVIMNRFWWGRKSFGRPASSSSSSSSSSELDDEGAVAGPEAGAEAELAPLLATYPYCRPVGRRAVGEEHEKTVMTGGRGSGGGK